MPQNRPGSRALQSLLQSGLDQLNLKLPPATLEKIMAYVELLSKWSKVHNLTAIREPQAILIRHIFDSLAIVPFIQGTDILDFGTGAGLPGIPLALALPEYNLVLLDSSRKKTAFLNHVVLSLDIKNVNIATSRIETFHFPRPFATITTRATAKSDEVIDKTYHLLAKPGQILIMKGKNPQAELKIIQESFVILRLAVPYLDEERHLVRVLN